LAPAHLKLRHHLTALASQLPTPELSKNSRRRSGLICLAPLFWRRAFHIKRSAFPRQPPLPRKSFCDEFSGGSAAEPEPLKVSDPGMSFSKLFCAAEAPQHNQSNLLPKLSQLLAAQQLMPLDPKFLQTGNLTQIPSPSMALRPGDNRCQPTLREEGPRFEPGYPRCG